MPLLGQTPTPSLLPLYCTQCQQPQHIPWRKWNRGQCLGDSSPAGGQQPWGTRTHSSKQDRLFNTTLAENTFHMLAVHFPACAWGRGQAAQEGRVRRPGSVIPWDTRGKVTHAVHASALSTQRGSFQELLQCCQKPHEQKLLLPFPPATPWAEPGTIHTTKRCHEMRVWLTQHPQALSLFSARARVPCRTSGRLQGPGSLQCARVQSQPCGQGKAKEDGCPQGTPRVVLGSCPRAAPHLPSLQLSVLKAAGGTGMGTSRPRNTLSASSTRAPRGSEEGRFLLWQKMLQGGAGGTASHCQRVQRQEQAPVPAATSLGTTVSVPASCSARGPGYTFPGKTHPPKASSRYRATASVKWSL